MAVRQRGSKVRKDDRELDSDGAVGKDEAVLKDIVGSQETAISQDAADLHQTAAKEPRGQRVRRLPGINGCDPSQRRDAATIGFTALTGWRAAVAVSAIVWLGLAAAGCSPSPDTGAVTEVHRAVPATSPIARTEGSANAQPPASKQPPASAPAGTSSGSALEEAPVVTAEPDIFDRQGEKYEASLGDGWETSPAFLVVSDDVSKAADALGRAAVRFFHLDEYGSELAPEQRLAEEQAAKTWEAAYTPNFVSDVYLTPRGPMVWTDTKGELTRQMGDAMLHVLLDELRVEGITAHVVAPPADITLEGVPVIPLAG